MGMQRDIYNCGICGNTVEVESAGEGQLVCCGQPMRIMKANTADAAAEKHASVIEMRDGGVLVKVGSIAHPMEEKHHIVYVEICADGIIMRKYLRPGNVPEVFFKTDAKNIQAWEYCNLHGLWRT
jgi:superoxide reductase